MINRVQAFSNKNNYNQNFGMAVVKRPGAGSIMRRMSYDWNRVMGTEETQNVLTSVEKLRRNDARCDIVIRPLEAEDDGIHVALCDKESGIRIKKLKGGETIPSYDFTLENDPVQFEDALRELSALADTYEMEPLGPDLLKDIPLKNN